MRSTSLLAAVAFLLAALPCAGCATVHHDDDREIAGEDDPSPAAAPLDVCIVDAPAGTETLRASERGVVFFVRTAVRSEDGVAFTAQRARGHGCDLALDQPVLAVEGVFDLDDRGAVYARPAAPSYPGPVSTERPGATSRGSAMRIDEAGAITELFAASRGLDDFGVAPGGDAMWVGPCPGCGTPGIYAAADAPVGAETVPLVEAPPLEEGRLRGVLTDGDTFFSIGPSTCAPSEPVVPSCGRGLVRTTAAGSAEVGSTIRDLGHGFEQAQLRRCGAEVCGVFPSAVVVWTGAGEERMHVTRDDLLAGSAEGIFDAAGSSEGVYVVLQSDTGSARIAFVAWP